MKHKNFLTCLGLVIALLSPAASAGGGGTVYLPETGQTCILSGSVAVGCDDGFNNKQRNRRNKNPGYRQSYIGEDGYRYTDPSVATGNCEMVDTVNGWQCRSGR